MFIKVVTHTFNLMFYWSSSLWCDDAFRIMVRKIFSPFWQCDGSRLLLILSDIGPSLSFLS